MKPVRTPYPFFFIVDDGGFDYATGKDKTGRIGMDTYENIAKLARDFKMRIPVCFTAKFLDTDNLSGAGEPLDYANELVVFLKRNTDAIEIGYHGLTHEYENRPGEFFCLDDDSKVPEEVQRDHIEKSKVIFDQLGIEFPKIFVPPYHAWEVGVTDKLLAGAGVRYLVSYPALKYAGKRYRWEKSDCLEFLPRGSLGLYGDDYDIGPEMTRKVNFYPRKKLVEFAKDYLIPQRLLPRLRLSKTPVNVPVHSYMAHIGNFAGRAIGFWYDLLDFVKSDPRFIICRDNAQAAAVYRQLKKNG